MNIFVFETGRENLLKKILVIMGQTFYVEKKAQNHLKSPLIIRVYVNNIIYGYQTFENNHKIALDSSKMVTG